MNYTSSPPQMQGLQDREIRKTLFLFLSPIFLLKKYALYPKTNVLYLWKTVLLMPFALLFFGSTYDFGSCLLIRDSPPTKNAHMINPILTLHSSKILLQYCQRIYREGRSKRARDRYQVFELKPPKRQGDICSKIKSSLSLAVPAALANA